MKYRWSIRHLYLILNIYTIYLKIYTWIVKQHA